MVVDCQILVSVKETGVPAAPTIQQTLYPPYHHITLPLNNINFMFEKCLVSFNQTSELTSDKYVYCFFISLNFLFYLCLSLWQKLPFGLGWFLPSILT